MTSKNHNSTIEKIVEEKIVEIVKCEIENIEIDANGLCRWTDVANALTHIRAQLNALELEPKIFQAPKGEAYQYVCDNLLESGDDADKLIEVIKLTEVIKR